MGHREWVSDPANLARHDASLSAAVLNQLCFWRSLRRNVISRQRRSLMPVNKEFAITMEDKPGTFGKFGRVLADNNVNIIAFQSYPFERKSEVRLIVDNHTAAKKILDATGIPYTEVEVAQVKLQHRPGELARVAS